MVGRYFMKWPRIAFAVLIIVVAPMFVVTQFGQKQQPTQVLQPGTPQTATNDCFSVWCDDWKR